MVSEEFRSVIFYTARFICAGAVAAIAATAYTLCMIGLWFSFPEASKLTIADVTVVVTPTIVSFVIGMPILTLFEDDGPLSAGKAALLGLFAGVLVVVTFPIISIFGIIFFFFLETVLVLAILATSGMAGAVAALVVMRAFDWAWSKRLDA